MIYKDLLMPYNPWWENADKAFERLPDFHRPVFGDIYRGLKEIPQIISITGPRRVGKSTLIKQTIKKLIQEGGNPANILYYSLDDPALFRSKIERDKIFESLMEEAKKKGEKGLLYVFLDEIQRFDGWELFLKKYYDLKYPVRFAISGSASSPIFKKSRESLLGRIKDYHILPFSFREFVLFHCHGNPKLKDVFDAFIKIYNIGASFKGYITGDLLYANIERLQGPDFFSKDLIQTLDKILEIFLLEGGFPEVWGLPDWETKQSYLFDNQVTKVISEDLVIAVELRKPEILKKFYISLLENPGREINFQRLSEDLGINRATIEKYFPLLEMTDLVHHAEKFSKSPIKIRRGNIKCYLVDLALRNAVLRLQKSLLQDQQTLGLYAENLVFNALRKWKGTLNINYYRDKNEEIDFIAHLGANRYFPVEVKYQEQIKDADLKNIKNFCSRFKTFGFVITKRWEEFHFRKPLLLMPLPYFLLMFD